MSQASTDPRLSAGEEAFERARRTAGFLLVPLAFVGLLLVPADVLGLEPKAHRLAAILAATVLSWILEPIPIAVTALFGAAMSVLLGVGDAKSVFAAFGDPILFVFIGSFFIARAMSVHGLDRRMALAVLALPWVGDSTRRMLFVFGAIAAFLSLWLSNSATTAMLLPIGLGILHEVQGFYTRSTGHHVPLSRMRLSHALVLMVPFAASVGGIGTPIGTPPNLIGIGIIAQQPGRTIQFFEWMRWTIPLVVVLYLVLYAILLWLYPPEVDQVTGLSAFLRQRRAELGRWSAGERNTAVAFGVAVTLWVMPGVTALLWGAGDPFNKELAKVLPEAVAAVLAALVLFATPTDWASRTMTLTWDDAVHIDWGTVLVFGGGLALGQLTFTTGLAQALADLLHVTTGVSSPAVLTFIVIAFAILLSETTSNMASATMVVPIAIAVAKAANIDPLLPALGGCLGSSWGFMLPVSTAPNAIAYGTGLVPVSRMARAGFVFDVCGLFILWGGLLALNALGVF